MKLALAFSTKDRVELTFDTIPRYTDTDKFDLFWIDGSRTEEGRKMAADFAKLPCAGTKVFQGVTGGADAAIVFALTQMLKDESYTHVGLLENDVLLSPDWFEQTMALFERGHSEGLDVGAVTARTYEDRILIQRDGYAVLHNAGAGHIIFTRRAAELVLAYYRTGWWPDNRRIFSQLSGLDIGNWGCFRTYDTPVTADWHFDTILAAHGLAVLGATPALADMIGQEPSLEEQGLKLATGPVYEMRNDAAFSTFVHHTRCVREGKMQLHFTPWLEQRAPSGANYLTYFAHQLPRIGARFTDRWKLKWAQGFGPFSYVSDEGACTVPIYGPCSIIVSGGEKGARIKVSDSKSGYEVSSKLEPEGETMSVLSLQMPGGVSYREIRIDAEPGAKLFAIQTNEVQPWFPEIKFDYNTLPKVD